MLPAADDGVTETFVRRKFRQTADQRLAMVWSGAAERTTARALTIAAEMPHFRRCEKGLPSLAAGRKKSFDGTPRVLPGLFY